MNYLSSDKAILKAREHTNSYCLLCQETTRVTLEHKGAGHWLVQFTGQLMTGATRIRTIKIIAGPGVINAITDYLTKMTIAFEDVTVTKPQVMAYRHA